MDDYKPTVCVDLDGVLNLYDGWKGAEYFHPPRPGAREFLQALQEGGYLVIVFTVRWQSDVEKWLIAHDLSQHVALVTDKKPPAHVYIDDRAICFQGDFASTLAQIASFKAHWETTRE